MSVVNSIMGRRQQPVPVPGMGATILMHSDRHACTIRVVMQDKHGNPTCVGVTRDSATRIDHNGMSEDQKYLYEPGPWKPGDACIFYTVRSDGSWVRRGDPLKHGERISIGERSEFRDPHY